MRILGSLALLGIANALNSPLERYNVWKDAEKALRDESPSNVNERLTRDGSKGRRLDGIDMITPNLRLPGNHGNAGVDQKYYRCTLDSKVSAETLPFFHNDIERMWGAACGRNRGVFVMTPSDGHTYGCGNLPPELNVGQTVSSLTNPNTSSTDAVRALQVIVEAIYNTSTTKDSGACDFDAMSFLQCGREEPWRTAPWADKLKAPIRAVNVGGLFALERWITPGLLPWGTETGIVDQYTFSQKCEALGICDVLRNHWETWYSLSDFQQMKQYGLNTIRLPVGWWYFAHKAGVDPSPYLLPTQDLYDPDHPITNIIRWARDAGLYVIMDLHGAPGSQNGLDNSGRASSDPDNIHWGESWLYSPQNMADTIKTLAAIAEYINRLEDMFGLDNVIALELLNEPFVYLDMGLVRDFYFTGIATVRLVRPRLPVFLHDAFRGPLWTSLLKNFPWSEIYMDTHIYHGFNPSDAASDTEEMDRQKQFTHEQMSCGYSSMLRYQTCSALPTFVGEWSLAIDNCQPWLDPKFSDYGQCDRIADRLTNSWWTSHVKSFAMRQISMFERELGWSFWCWKVDSKAMRDSPSSAFWSFQQAVNHGYIDIRYNTHACVHPPAMDWELTSPEVPAQEEPAFSDSDEPGSPGDEPETAATEAQMAVKEPTERRRADRISNVAAALLALLGAATLILASVAGSMAARRRCRGYQTTGATVGANVERLPLNI